MAKLRQELIDGGREHKGRDGKEKAPLVGARVFGQETLGQYGMKQILQEEHTKIDALEAS